MDKIIQKTDFIDLDANSVIMQAVSFDKRLVGHTTYLLEIGITRFNKEECYSKSLRFKDLEALDTVFKEKFKNLKFTTLPSKDIF